jgi:hypothetical protein
VKDLYAERGTEAKSRRRMDRSKAAVAIDELKEKTKWLGFRVLRREGVELGLKR